MFQFFVLNDPAPGFFFFEFCLELGNLFLQRRLVVGEYQAVVVLRNDVFQVYPVVSDLYAVAENASKNAVKFPCASTLPYDNRHFLAFFEGDGDQVDVFLLILELVCQALVDVCIHVVHKRFVRSNRKIVGGVLGGV